jgi:hypothetical protein
MSDLDDFRREIRTPAGFRRYTLNLQAMLATGWAIRPFAICMLELREKTVSSGTVLRLGNHVFIATARHVIPENPNGRFWIVRRQPRSASEGFPGFVKWRLHPNAHIDVGYLEAECDSLVDYLGHDDFCTIENLADFGPGRENRGIIVVGGPAEKIRHLTDGERSHVMAFELMPYGTPCLSPNNWPKVGAQNRPPHPDIDVFLEYPNECFDVEPNGVTSVATLPHPGGMSGGGVWDQGFAQPDGLWTPRDCKLFAIQSSWNESKRYLRATQIRHWIDLIREDYPDLRDALSTVQIEK